MQPITWFLVGDSSRARLFQGFDRHTLNLVKEFSHPEGREHQRDIVSAPDGRFQQAGRSEYGVTLEPKHTPEENERTAFAKELALFLEEGANRQDFDRLVLVAPPQFLGALRRELNDQVSKRVAASLDKDLTWMPVPEISERLLSL